MKKFNEGFTFVEMLIAIAIIVVMSTVFWTTLHHDKNDVVRQETERLAAELRQVRALSVARVPEKSIGKYPAGGYGIHLYNDPPRYIVFADINDIIGYDSSVDIKLKERFFPADITELVDLGIGSTNFYFRFKSINEIITNLRANPQDFYAIGIVADDYRGNIRLGENTEDGLLWTNIGISYDDVIPEEAAEGGGGGKINLEGA